METARERHGQGSMWAVLQQRPLSPRRAQTGRGRWVYRLSELALALSRHRRGQSWAPLLLPTHSPQRSRGPGPATAETLQIPRLPGSYPGAAEHKSLVSHLSSALGAPCDLRWPRQVSPPHPFGCRPPLTPSCPTAPHYRHPQPRPKPRERKYKRTNWSRGTRSLYARRWGWHEPCIIGFNPQITR